MPAKRKAIEPKYENKSWVAYFMHPLSKRTVRCRLGTEQAAANAKCAKLNEVFLTPSKWAAPDFGQHEDLKTMWTGKATGVPVRAGEKTSAAMAAGLRLSYETLLRDHVALQTDYAKLRRLYEDHTGRRVRSGPCPSLKKALDDWKAGYVGRDPDHAYNVACDLQRFVNHFKPETPVDDLDRREKEIDAWLRGLKTKEQKDAKGNVVKPARPISAGRRQQMRRHVLRFLHDNGLRMDRSKDGVAPVSVKQVRDSRGAIRWLTSEQVAALAGKLEGDWRDAFELQAAIGLRPSEIPTLKKSDLGGDSETLTLSPLGLLTLKTGSRTITLSRYPVAQEILKRRAEKHAILFNHDGAAWDLDYWHKCYSKALKDAATAAGIAMKIDARVPRRTCASLLIRAGKSIEAVAALLGDDPATVREHYGKLRPEEA